MTVRSRSGRRAAAALELALVLPLLVTLAFGCVDLGRFAYTYIAVTGAARAAADFGSRNPVTPFTRDAWVQRIRQAAADDLGQGFSAQQLTVSIAEVQREANLAPRARVQVSYPFQTVTRWPYLPRISVLTRKVEMPVIRQ